MAEVLRIGNAQAFWGDSPGAPGRLLSQQPDLDYLTLDYLAEVSLSILAEQRERDPWDGYARDFVDVVRSIVPLWRKGMKTRLVSNAGGLNPLGCGEACRSVLRESGCSDLSIYVVGGDDVLSQLKSESGNESYKNLETGESIGSVIDRLVTANAYLGAEAIAQALGEGADIVVTGRVADPSLTVAACMAHFGWSAEDYDRIGGATVAGHLIECGTQVTGGISTDWLNLPGVEDLGFPFVEMSEDGSFVITKPEGTGGRVDIDTVREQLLYEIGNPGQYLSPDATVSFLTLATAEEGDDRVRISGATGCSAPSTLKVSATYRDGFKAHGMLTIFGRDAVEKAKKCGAIVLGKVKDSGFEPGDTLIECLGAGASVPGVVPLPFEDDLLETVLRVSVADSRREAGECFRREFASLVTAGPQGVTGYGGGRPRIQPVFSYWPCLVERERVIPFVEEV